MNNIFKIPAFQRRKAIPKQLKDLKLLPLNEQFSKLTSAIVGDDDLRQVMMGNFFDIENKKIVSTDAHKLTAINMPNETFNYISENYKEELQKEPRGLIFKRLSQLQNDYNDLVKIANKNNSTDFQSFDEFVKFRAIEDGRYPNYEPIIPKEFTNEINVDYQKLYWYAKVLIDAKVIDDINKIDSSNEIVYENKKIEYLKDSYVSFLNPISKQIILTYTLDGVKQYIGFNAKFLCDVLKFAMELNGKTFGKVGISGNSRAMIIELENGLNFTTNSIALIMPVMLSDNKTIGNNGSPLDKIKTYEMYYDLDTNSIISDNENYPIDEEIGFMPNKVGSTQKMTSQQGKMEKHYERVRKVQAKQETKVENNSTDLIDKKIKVMEQKSKVEINSADLIDKKIRGLKIALKFAIKGEKELIEKKIKAFEIAKKMSISKENPLQFADGLRKGQLVLFKNKYFENEDNNKHSENVLLLAQNFGTQKDIDNAVNIVKQHEKDGQITTENRKKRMELDKSLMDKAIKIMSENNIMFFKNIPSEKMSKVNNNKIKEWYIKNYPDDDLSYVKELDDKTTFEDLWIGLERTNNIFEVIGISDSVVRERLFEHLAELKGVTYNVVYDKWLEDKNEENWVNRLESVTSDSSWNTLTIEKIGKNFPYKLNDLNKILQTAGGKRNGKIYDFSLDRQSNKYDSFLEFVYSASIILNDAGSDSVSPSGTYFSQKSLPIRFYLRLTIRKDGNNSPITINASKDVAGGMSIYKSIEVNSLYEIEKYINLILRDNPPNNLKNMVYKDGGEIGEFARGGGVAKKERLDAILERRTEINNFLNKKYGKSRGNNKAEKDKIDALAKEYRKLGDEYLELNGGYNEYAGGGEIGEFESPRIYIIDKEAYNNNIEDGIWLDFSDYKNTDELMTAIQEFLDEREIEEYEITDGEYLPTPMGMDLAYLTEVNFEEIYLLMDIAKEKGISIDDAYEEMYGDEEFSKGGGVDNKYYVGKFQTIRDWNSVVKPNGVRIYKDVDGYPIFKNNKVIKVYKSKKQALDRAETFNKRNENNKFATGGSLFEDNFESEYNSMSKNDKEELMRETIGVGRTPFSEYEKYNQLSDYHKELVDNYFTRDYKKMADGGSVLANNEIMQNIEFEDDTDRKFGRYNFSFDTIDSEGANMFDYDGYIIVQPSSSRQDDEIEWGQNVPEDYDKAESILIDAFYEWKNKKMANGGSVGNNLENMFKLAKEEILQDIKNGTIDGEVNSFQDLYDYVDANCYGGICENDYKISENYELENKLHKKLDNWIKNGGTKIKKQNYARGGQVIEIQKIKNRLISKAKSKGIYENFGQNEVRMLEDKYGNTNEVREFDNWAMNFDLSDLKQYAGGGGIEDSPSIYVADLEAYNNGRLNGEWLKLTDYNNADELMEAIQELLDKWGVEEYAIHDTEYIPSNLRSEYMGQRDFEQLYEMIDLANEYNLPLEVVQDVVSQFDASAVEEYIGKYDNTMDFAEQQVDEVGLENFSSPEYYVYMSDTDRRLLAGEMSDSYVEDIKNEDGGNRVIEEAGLDVSEYEEADSERQEEMVDEAVEIVREEYYDTWYDGLDDPYEFLVEQQGMYSPEDFFEANFISVDYEKIASALEDDYTFIYDSNNDLYVFNIR